jgi:hypothetical protein
MPNSIIKTLAYLSACSLLLACDSSKLTGQNQKKSDRRLAPPGEPSAADGTLGSSVLPNDPGQINPNPEGSNTTNPLIIKPPTNAETKVDADKAAQLTDFAGWCSKGQETTPVTSGRLKSLFSELCDGNQPRELLTKHLIASAYLGTGEPQFTDLKPMVSNATTRISSYRFAIAIKIPIPIKDYFDKVAPKAGDVNEIKKLQESTGAKATVTLLESHGNDGPYHVQGWTTRSVAFKNVLVINVESSAATRNDSFKFVDSAQYLFTQSTYDKDPITKALPKTVKYFDYMAAGVKIGDNHYLIAAVDVALDHYGFATTAEAEIRKLMVFGIKQMHTLAANAK